MSALRSRRRRPVAVAFVLLVALGVAACGDAGESASPHGSSAPQPEIEVLTTEPEPVLPATVESADGKQVVVEDIDRIVVLRGSIAELIFSFGLGDEVVGRDVTTTFAEAEALPLVTRAHDVSAEAVLSLKPTLVFASTETGPPEALEQISAAGVAVVVVPEAVDVAGIAARTKLVAQALGVPALGDELVAKVHSSIDSVIASVPDHPPTRVAFLYLRGQAGVYLLGGEGSGADAMIEAAGGIDVGSDMGLGPFTPLTSEALVNAAPDALLLMTGGLDSIGGVSGLLELPGIAETPAGRDGRVVAIEDGLLLSFGPRTPLALQQFVHDLYGTTPSDEGDATP